MKHPAMFIVLSLLVLFNLSCSKKNGTGPDEDGGTVLAAAAIGPEGGSFGDSRCSVLIPENAFQVTAQLEISESSSGHPFPGHSASEVYRLKGLPEILNQPVTVRIRYYTNISDTLFAALGKSISLPDLNETMMDYRYTEGRDSSGYLIFELPTTRDSPLIKMNRLPVIKAEESVLQLSLVTDFVKLKIFQKSEIVGPSDEAETVQRAAESLFSNLEQMGAAPSDDYHTIVIYIEPSLPYMEWRAIEFNRTKWEEDDNEKTEHHTCGIWVDASRMNHEDFTPQLGRCLFQFFVQRDFAPPGQYDIAEGNVPNNRNLWLHAAIAAWSEIFFACIQDEQKTGYTPSYFLQNKAAPFHQAGLAFDVGDYREHLDFGYGMSSFIQYLAMETGFDENGIVAFYHELEISSPECHLSVLIERLGKPMETVWSGFIEKYLNGNVIEYIVPNLVEPLRVDWSVDGEEDTEWSYQNEYPDICCDLKRISFDREDMPDRALLKLHLDSSPLGTGLCEMQVYEYTGNGLNALGKAADSGLLVNVKGLCDSRHDLVLATLKSAYRLPGFNGSDPMRIQAVLETQPWWTPVCQIDAYLWANVHWESKLPNSPPPEDTDFYLGPSAMTEQAYWVACEDDQFEARWDYTDAGNPNLHLTGQMTLVYDSDTKTITSFQCDQVLKDQTSDGMETTTYSITGMDLPCTETGDSPYSNKIVYSVEGSGAHSHVTDLKYTYDGTDSYQSINNGPYTDSSNWIQIMFHIQ